MSTEISTVMLDEIREQPALLLCKLADALHVYCDNSILVQRKDAPTMNPDSLPVATNDVEFVNAIEYLIPMQVLSYLISYHRGIDVTIPLVDKLDGVMLPAYED